MWTVFAVRYGENEWFYFISGVIIARSDGFVKRFREDSREKQGEKRFFYPHPKFGRRRSILPAGTDDDGNNLDVTAAQRDPAGGFLSYREEAELSKHFFGRGLEVKIVFKNEILSEVVPGH